MATTLPSAKGSSGANVARHRRAVRSHLCGPGRTGSPSENKGRDIAQPRGDRRCIVVNQTLTIPNEGVYSGSDLRMEI
jgi:hypothetical protein